MSPSPSSSVLYCSPVDSSETAALHLLPSTHMETCMCTICTSHTQYVDVVHGRSSFSPPLSALVAGHRDCVQRKPNEPEIPPAFEKWSD